MKVTDHRTARDFADCMRDLADIHYPDADRIRVVMDNLSTHTAGALYEAFPAPEAHRVLQRLEFHYTPKHASWLNMVEIEIGVLRGQCLDRRIGEREVLVSEIDAWERQRNASGARDQMEVHHAKGTGQAGPRLSRHRQRVIITVYGAYRCQENFAPIFAGGLGWLRRAWNSFYGVSCAVQRHSFDVRYGDRGSFERSIHASLPLFAEKNQSGLLDR